MSKPFMAFATTARRFAHRFTRDQSGAIIMEFALAVPILLLMLIGIMEFAYAYAVKNSVTLAARDGARYALVNGSESSTTADSAAVADFVKTRVPLQPLLVSTTWPTSNDPGEVVRVTVAHDYKPLSGLGIVPSLKFSSTSEMVISY